MRTTACGIVEIPEGIFPQRLVLFVITLISVLSTMPPGADQPILEAGRALAARLPTVRSLLIYFGVTIDDSSAVTSRFPTVLIGHTANAVWVFKEDQPTTHLADRSSPGGAAQRLRDELFVVEHAKAYD